jgi:hypothetical protein
VLSRSSRRAQLATVATIAAAVWIPAAAHAHDPVGAAAGPHYRPSAVCDTNALVTVSRPFLKFGPAAQTRGFSVHFYDLNQGRYTYSSGWRQWTDPYGASTWPEDSAHRVGRSRYRVYVYFGWWTTLGWVLDGNWAANYHVGDFAYPTEDCNTSGFPVTVSDSGCAAFGNICASATARSARPRLPRRPKPPALAGPVAGRTDAVPAPIALAGTR